MRPTIRYAGVVVLLAIGAIVVVLWLGHAPEPGPGSPRVKLVVGAETSMLTAAIWVAENRGHFQSQGLDVEIREFDSGKMSFEAMLNGEGIDIVTVAPTPIMFKSFTRDDFAIIATFVYSYDDVKVIARRDRDIDEAADLRGRTIGTPLGTTGQFFLDAFLADNEILASDVTIEDVDPSDSPGALASGRVDAIVIWEPHAYQALQLLPDKTVRLLGASPRLYKETFNFVAMKDTLVARRDALVAFLAAMDQATTFLRTHGPEAQELVAQRLSLDRATTAAVWDDLVFEMSLDQTLIRTLELEGLWAISRELVGEAALPNYLDFVHLPALQQVKPEAVTIQK